METILRFFSKLSALLIGPVLYLGKTLLIDLGASFIYALLGLLLVVGSPLLTAAYLLYKKVDTALTVLISIVAAPLLLIVAASATALFAAGLALAITYDFFNSLITGFNAALADGWEQIINDLTTEDSFHFSIITIPFALIESLIQGNDNSDEFDNEAFDDLNQNQEEQSDDSIDSTEQKIVSRMKFKEPDLPLAKQTLYKINDNADYNQQLNQATTVLKNHEKIKQLKLLIEQYEDLHNRIQKLQKVIDEDIELEDGDELVSFTNVLTPILLVKEYEIEKNQWITIPATTKITDKNSLLQWLTTNNPVHPIFKDHIQNPEKHNGYPTRYQWHEYKGESMELNELSQKIRVLTKAITEQPVKESEKNQIIAKSLGLMLWTSPTVSQEDHPQANIIMPL